jgi:hypothetical protein
MTPRRVVGYAFGWCPADQGGVRLVIHRGAAVPCLTPERVKAATREARTAVHPPGGGTFVLIASMPNDGHIAAGVSGSDTYASDSLRPTPTFSLQGWCADLPPAPETKKEAVPVSAGSGLAYGTSTCQRHPTP